MIRATAGLGGPITALFLYALLFQPFIAQNFPNEGWIGLAFSPQTFFLLSALIIIWIRRLRMQDAGLQRQNLSKNVLLGLGLGLIPPLLILVLGCLFAAANRFLPFLPRPIFGGSPLQYSVTMRNLFILL